MNQADNSFRAGRRQARQLDLKHGRIELTHGAGGRAMADLIDLVFRRAFDNPLLNQANDQACFDLAAGRMVMSTDSFVISPLFFLGGDIGSLAVHGTVNDLAMGGAQPLYLTAGFILEEGLPLADLARIVDSMAAAARATPISRSVRRASNRARTAHTPTSHSYRPMPAGQPQTPTASARSA